MDLLKPSPWTEKSWKTKEKSVLVNPSTRFTQTRARVRKWLPTRESLASSLSLSLQSDSRGEARSWRLLVMGALPRVAGACLTLSVPNSSPKKHINIKKWLSPEFRATRLWRGFKKGPLWRFSAYFPVFKAKKGPRKICAKPWLPVIRA